MLKEFVLIENNKYYQYSNIEGIIKHLLGDNYYNLSKEEKIESMKLNAELMCASSKKIVVDITNRKIENIDLKECFVIYDEITYILSVLLTNKYMLLENKEIDALVKGLEMDKSALKDNYIIVNKFAEKLLLNYINNI